MFDSPLPNPPGSQLIQTDRGHNFLKGTEALKQSGKIPSDAGCPNPVVVAAGIVTPLIAAHPSIVTPPPSLTPKVTITIGIATVFGGIVLGDCQFDPVCSCVVFDICPPPCDPELEDCG